MNRKPLGALEMSLRDGKRFVLPHSMVKIGEERTLLHVCTLKFRLFNKMVTLLE